MALKMTNTSAKVIGIGDVTVLPGETKEVPSAYESSPILEVYKSMGFVILSGKTKAQAEADKKAADEKAAAEKAAADAAAQAEADRKVKLASLKDATDEEVAALAKELGINPAECKDLADVRKKVKAALSK